MTLKTSNSTRKRATGAHLASLVVSAAIGAVPQIAFSQTTPLPSGASVVAGQATVQASGNALNVNASTSRAIVNWDSFNVGTGKTATFNLPSANAAILNRVVTPNLSSSINGTLSSNGSVYLVNPSGIMVGSQGVVNTNGFTATTYGIANDAFMTGGNLKFSDYGSAASVVNNGMINTGAGGAHLLANEIANHGSITSTGGNITLFGGGDVTLSNGVDYVLPSMQTLTGGISPTAGLIQNSGTIRATGAATSGGEVYLVNPNGKILHDGTIAAQNVGANNQSTGGHVQLEASDITLMQNSSIDVSGTLGGGTALVGGDWQGSGTMTQATTVTMQDGASVDASAIESGDGGKIVLWSDITNKESMTSVAGTLTARGGASGGDGGQIETSGAHIDTANVAVNAGADEGTGGLWLIDPFSYVIETAEAGNIAGALNNGTSVTVTTALDDSSQGSNGVDSANGGLLRVLNPITKTSGGDATLTLKSDRNMEIENSITSTFGKLNLVLWANQDDFDQGSVAFENNNSGIASIDITTNGGHLWIGGGAGSTTWNGMTVGDGAAHAAEQGSFTSGIQFLNIATNITTADGSIYMAGTTAYSLSRDIRFGGGAGTTIDAGSGSIELVGDNISFTNDSTLETTGELIISPLGTSFVDDSNAATAFTWDGTRSGSDLDGTDSLNGLIIKNVDSLGGLTLGKDGTTSEIIINADTDIAGDVSVYAGTIDVFGDLTAAGDILLDADTGSQIDYDGIGVKIENATVSTTAASNGSITIVGRGGNQNGQQQGVTLAANSQLTAGGTGDVTITGFGGDEISDGNHHGILLLDNNGITAGGDIVLTGNGGGSIGGGGNNDGVRLNGGKIGSDSSGSVTINGTTNADGLAAQDILIFGVGSEIRTGAGNDILLRGDSFGLGDNGPGPTPAARTTTIGNSTSTIGTLTFESVSDSFVDTGFSLPELTLEHLGGLVVGKSTNTANVMIDPVLDLGGSLDIHGGDIQSFENWDVAGTVNINGDEITTAGIWNVGGAVNVIGDGETLVLGGPINTTGDNALLKNTGDIEVVANASMTTLGGDITLWSDSDNNGNGYIHLEDNVTLNSQTAGGTSGGGNITLAGGLDSNADGRPDGLAASPFGSGVTLGFSGANTTTMLSGGGDVVVRGKGLDDSDAAVHNYGVEAIGLLTVDSGTGTISIVGESSDNTAVFFSQGKTGGTALDLKSAATSGDAIAITGTATGSAGHGVSFTHDTSAKTLQATGGGDIKVTGTGPGFGIDMHNTNVLASAGDIVVDSSTNENRITDSVFGAEAGSQVTSSTSDITITSDNIELLGTTGLHTSGHVTLQPKSTSFSTAFDDLTSSVTFDSSVSGLTIGKHGNTSDILIDEDLELHGPLNVHGGFIFVSGDIDTSNAANGDVLLKSTGAIELDNGDDIITSGGSIILWSDTDADGNGNIELDGRGTLDTRTAADRAADKHTSGGGDIIFAGGLDIDQDGRPDGFASSFTEDGIHVGASGTLDNFYSGGGDIVFRGKATSGTTPLAGFNGNGRIFANSGTGTITIQGQSASDHGVTIGQNGSVVTSLEIQSAATSGTAITIIGTTGHATANGIDIGNGLTSPEPIKATAGGDILINGVAAGSGYGLYMGRGVDIVANSGDLVIDGNAGGIYGSEVVFGAAAAAILNSGPGDVEASSSSGDITLIGDRIEFPRPAVFDTTGVVTIQPHSASFTSPLLWNGTDVTAETTWGGLTLGKAGNTGDITIAKDQLVDGHINIYGGNLAIEGALDSTPTDGTITLGSTGTITQSSIGLLTAANLNITTNDGNAGLSNADVILQGNFNHIETLTANVDGTLRYRDVDALSLGNGAGSGISATESIQIDTLSGNMTINDDVATADTTDTALVLNAGANRTAGDSEGGNIIVNSSPSVTVGNGGRATLYSGDVDGSTGLTSLVQSGSGRFRYNSDENVDNFTLALGAGVNAVYREQPTITVAADNTSITYGDAASTHTATVGSKNGDTTAQAFPNITFAESGATSTSGHRVAGTHTITATPGANQLGYAVGTTTTGTLTVNKKSVAFSGITAANKTYDGNTSSTLDLSGATLAGVVSGDNVTATLSGTTGTFADKNVEQGKTVVLSGTSYNGSDIGNYNFTNQTATNADITAKSVIVSGITAANKTYDGNTSATLDHSGLNLAGVISGDDVMLSGTTGSFADKNVEQGKTVVLSGTSYSGDDISNYNFTNQTATNADITAKSVVVSGITANDKTYDGNASATLDHSGLTLAGVFSGDDVTLSGTTGSFADKNVEQGKTVVLSGTSYSGSDVNNYNFSNQTATNADITAKSVNFSGITATDKVYDGNTSATLDLSGATLTGIVSGDDVTVSLSGTAGTFADKNVEQGKTVVLSGTSYSGADIGNYNFTNQSVTNADITTKSVVVSGITANDKTYDGNTSATLDHSGLILAGVISGDDVTLSGTTGSFADKNVEQGKTVVLSGTSYSGSDVNNYNFTDQTATHADIDSTPLTVRINNDARFVTKADPNGFAGAVYDGFVANENTSDLGGSLLITHNGVGIVEAAGTYAGVLLGSGLTSTNYDISYIHGDLTIVPAEKLLVRFGNSNSTYGDSLDYSLLSAKYMDAGNVVHTLASPTVNDNVYLFSDGAGGSAELTIAPLSPNYSTGGILGRGNYDLQITNSIVQSNNFSQIVEIAGNHTVNRAAVNVGTGGLSKTYDGTVGLSGVDWHLSGIMANDTVGASGQGAFASDNAGTNISYNLVDVALNGADSDNYVLSGGTSFSGTDGVITPRSVTIVAPIGSKLFDGNTNLAPTSSQLLSLSNALGVAGDTVDSITLTYDNPDVGAAKTLTPSAIVISDGNGGGNYVISLESNSISGIRSDSHYDWIGGPGSDPSDPGNWHAGKVPPSLQRHDAGRSFESSSGTTDEHGVLGPANGSWHPQMKQSISNFVGERRRDPAARKLEEPNVRSTETDVYIVHP